MTLIDDYSRYTEGIVTHGRVLADIVRHIPNAPVNLISIAQITKKGYSCLFDYKHVYLIDPNNMKMVIVI